MSITWLVPLASAVSAIFTALGSYLLNRRKQDAELTQAAIAIESKLHMDLAEKIRVQVNNEANERYSYIVKELEQTRVELKSAHERIKNNENHIAALETDKTLLTITNAELKLQLTTVSAELSVLREYISKTLGTDPKLVAAAAGIIHPH